MGGSFNLMFQVVPILIGIIFVIVIVSIVMRSARYINNARSPRQSMFVRIVAKRMEVSSSTSHHNHGNGAIHPTHSSRTTYYITLEFDTGERKEFLDVKSLYGLVVEGDEGYAAIQGDWIVAFERAPLV